MSKKHTAALYLALPLLMAVPVLRADPIRAPTDWDFDDFLRAISVNQLTEASDSSWLPSADDENWINTFALRWKRDHHWDAADPSPVPEPGALAPLLILAAGCLYFRKRPAALS